MRVLVLRPLPAGSATAARLAALGHRVVLAPVLALRPTGDPVPPGPFAGLVITSRNAVPAIRDLPGDVPPVWAVGRRTAESLARNGVSAVATAADAAALARLIVARTAPGRLLLAGGRDRNAEPRATLETAGFEVALWDTYVAARVARLPEAAAAALRDEALDAILHYSRRSATIARVLAHEAGLAAEFAGLRQLCLSADVAAALSDLPAARLAVAATPDEDALFDLLDIAAPNTGSRDA